MQELLNQLGANPAGEERTCPLCRSKVHVRIDDAPIAPTRPWHLRGLTGLNDYLQSLGDEMREWLVAIYLNGDLEVLSVETIGIGSVTSVRIDTGHIIARARVLGAKGFVLAHNHPSGDPRPSPADVRATRNLSQSAMECDVHMLGHVIMTDKGLSTVGLW